MIRLPGTLFSIILGQNPIVKWTPCWTHSFLGTLFYTFLGQGAIVKWILPQSAKSKVTDRKEHPLPIEKNRKEHPIGSKRNFKWAKGPERKTRKVNLKVASGRPTRDRWVQLSITGRMPAARPDASCPRQMPVRLPAARPDADFLILYGKISANHKIFSTSIPSIELI